MGHDVSPLHRRWQPAHRPGPHSSVQRGPRRYADRELTIGVGIIVPGVPERLLKLSFHDRTAVVERHISKAASIVVDAQDADGEHERLVPSGPRGAGFITPARGNNIHLWVLVKVLGSSVKGFGERAYATACAA